MTERKTSDRLSISQRVDPGNVPVPWEPPELPASTSSAGLPVKRDRTSSPPVPWEPAELPASPAAAAVVRDRKIAKRKPWAPPELPHARNAPRNLPATVADDGGRSSSNTPEVITGEILPAEPLAQQTTQAGPTIINIVNQVAAPAPVYVYPPGWGYWGWRGWWGGYDDFWGLLGIVFFVLLLVALLAGR